MPKDKSLTLEKMEVKEMTRLMDELKNRGFSVKDISQG